MVKVRIGGACFVMRIPNNGSQLLVGGALGATVSGTIECSNYYRLFVRVMVWKKITNNIQKAIL
jgi:hypothetical protein